VPSHNPTFVARNFTESEITYCQAQPSPSASFAARWVGKEAVFKSLGVKSKGAAAPMKDIEIINDESGVPTVHLHGDARTKAEEKGITKVLISLSHSEVRSAFPCPDLITDFALRMLPSPSLKLPRDSLDFCYLVDSFSY
jgi:phosphopantetheine--protein transferase-like protein